MMSREIEQFVEGLLTERAGSYVIVDIGELPPAHQDLLLYDLDKRSIGYSQEDTELAIQLPANINKRHDLLNLLRQYELQVQGL